MGSIFARAKRVITRVRKFVWIHTHLLSLIGLFIVFVTFVVKEGIRDRLRDRVTDLYNAELFFSTRSDISDLSDKVDELIDAQPDAPRLPTQKALIAGIQRLDKSLWTVVDRTWLAIDDIPNNESLEQQISAFHDRQTDYAYRVASSGLYAGLPPSAQNPLSKMYTDGMQLQDQIVTFSSSVYDLAEKARKSDERLLNVANWASYVLYGIGWSLTFVARFFGIEMAEDAIE